MERIPSEKKGGQGQARSAVSLPSGSQAFGDSPRQLAQAKAIEKVQDSPKQVAQRQKTARADGLPDRLRSNMEAMSGISLDDVRVHRNSDKPAQMQAHAYAQGRDIYLGAGQEKHLPHEAWHVVQQAQGRVKPTTQLKGKTAINDDKSLEREADVMGAKAMQLKPAPIRSLSASSPSGGTTNAVQRFINVYLEVDTKKKKALRARGKVKDFKGGTKAGTQGWVGVEKYRSRFKVEDDTWERENSSDTLQNEFTNPEAGHVLAQQNGGNGGDPENIFAQCGGTNNGKYKSFENDMRNALDEYDDDDDVTFVSYLAGTNITTGKISDHGLPEASDISSEDLSD